MGVATIIVIYQRWKDPGVFVCQIDRGKLLLLFCWNDNFVDLSNPGWIKQNGSNINNRLSRCLYKSWWCQWQVLLSVCLCYMDYSIVVINAGPPKNKKTLKNLPLEGNATIIIMIGLYTDCDISYLGQSLVINILNISKFIASHIHELFNLLNFITNMPWFLHDYLFPSYYTEGSMLALWTCVG